MGMSWEIVFRVGYKYEIRTEIKGFVVVTRILNVMWVKYFV